MKTNISKKEDRSTKKNDKSYMRDEYIEAFFSVFRSRQNMEVILRQSIISARKLLYLIKLN